MPGASASPAAPGTAQWGRPTCVPVGPAKPHPAGKDAWSDLVCQPFALRSPGSVLTGASRAGAADVASSAPARPEWLEGEACEAVTEEGWGGLGF